MSLAQHLDTIDRLRARPFPATAGRTTAGHSGPGYHVAELTRSEEFWDGDGSRREEVAEQWEAERDALALLLGERWGDAQVFALGSLLVRGYEGEDIPDPWDLLCQSVPDVHLWRADGRWLAVGVSQWDEELAFELLACVTVVDPP